VEAEISAAELRLETEQGYLRDAGLIKASLDRRIGELQVQKEDRELKTPAENARDMIKSLERKKAHYLGEMRHLLPAFNKFVETHLASMLAAEELGGPVVGGLVDPGDEVLEAGFNHQGRAKKARATGDDGQRQRRIDEIWGRANQDGETVRDEKEAAGAEMIDLTEELLNASSQSSGGSGGYVELKRDSAAARFLVRAKVAQFHPKDARRIRLVGFGRSLEEG
jgi:glycine/D-amino acid oxidase-like deaminating enzyme